MALVRGSAGKGGAAADSARAHVVLRAWVAVVAAPRLVGEATRPISVAGASLMALVRGARVRGAGTGAARAHILVRAGVPVVAGCHLLTSIKSVAFPRVAADA